MGFIDSMRAQGHAAWVGVPGAVRAGLPGCRADLSRVEDPRPVDAHIADAQVIDAIRTVCWQRDEHGVLRRTPEGLYGRRKLTALLRRTSLSQSLSARSPGA